MPATKVEQGFTSEGVPITWVIIDLNSPDLADEIDRAMDWFSTVIDDAEAEEIERTGR